ncbi:MAG: STAS/SEC14 domain-containing protein [Candidatus Magasanikiibacteriota bacterium]
MNPEKIKVIWDDKDKLVYIKLVGEFDQDHAEQAVQKYREVLDEIEEKDIVLNKVLYDITEAGDATIGARRIFASFARSITQSFKNLKVAYIDGPRLAMIVSRFIHRLTSIGEVRYFKTEEDARGWLRGE